MKVPLPDGAWLHVERLDGRGPPVVMLHGVLASSDAWRGVARRLHDAGRAAWLLDARGHGRASPPTPGMDWGPQAAAQDVVAALDALAPDGAHLVGHSRGATAAAWVAVERPDLARSLAVVCAPAEGGEAFRALHRRALAGLRPDAAPHKREALARLAALPDDAFPAQLLRRYRGAALVVEAEDDPYYSPTQTLFWRRDLPYAAFERVPGGHAFFAESEDKERWLAERILKHLEGAQRPT